MGKPKYSQGGFSMKRTTHMILLAVIAAGCSGSQADTEKNEPDGKDPVVSKKDKETAKGDLDRMQGEWVSKVPDDSLEGFQIDQVTIKGDQFTTSRYFQNDNPYNIKINEKLNPKRIDMYLLSSSFAFFTIGFGISCRSPDCFGTLVGKE